MNDSILDKTSENKKENYLNCDVKSYKDSLVYTKKLIVIAVSNIAYLRALFPEEVFGTRRFDTISLKIIKPKSNDAKILIGWLHGAFDALDKKYLKTISLSIYANAKEPENVLETYDFNLSYNDNVNLEISKNLQQKIKPNSVRIIRAIILSSQTLEELPEKLFMNMRLFYYDNITPEDYEPPGFKACDFENYNYIDGKVKIKVGNVHCLWHQLSLDINCSKTMVKNKEDYNSSNQTIEMDTGNESIHQEASFFKEEKPSSLPEEPLVKEINELKVSEDNSPVLIKRKIVCPCKLVDEKDLKLLKCAICTNWQHAVCFNILIEDESYVEIWEKDFKHCCKKCFEESNDKNLELTDRSMINLQEYKIHGLCIWRRAVYFCYKNTKEYIHFDDLIKILSINSATGGKLFTKLVKEKLLTCVDKKQKIFEVNKENLNEVIWSNFTDPTLVLKQEIETKQKNLLKNSSMEVETSKSTTEDLSDVEETDNSDIVSKKQKAPETSVQKAKKLKSSVSDRNIAQV